MRKPIIFQAAKRQVLNLLSNITSRRLKIDKLWIDTNKTTRKNQNIIRKCMKYIRKAKKEGTIRNYDIDMSIEEYLGDQR